METFLSKSLGKDGVEPTKVAFKAGSFLQSALFYITQNSGDMS